MLVTHPKQFDGTFEIVAPIGDLLFEIYYSFKMLRGRGMEVLHDFFLVTAIIINIPLKKCVNRYLIIPIVVLHATMYMYLLLVNTYQLTN